MQRIQGSSVGTGGRLNGIWRRCITRRETGQVLGEVFGEMVSEFERHLLLVRQPGWQDVEDWLTIARRVRMTDPSIAVFVVDSSVLAEDLIEAAATKPTLVVSPGPLGVTQPRRGRVLRGRPIAKLQQLHMLATAKVPVPRTALLRPETQLDAATWGQWVVEKPADLTQSSQGKGFRLLQPGEVRYRPQDDFPAGHPGRLAPMLIQRFIDTGSPISSWRVLMFLGRPLYSQLMVGPPPNPDDPPQVAMQALSGGTRRFAYDADIIAAATAAAGAFVDVPLLGVDVLREAGTGRVYVLEVNPGGNTWHFSSDHLKVERAENGPDFERQRREQLDAFGTAAHALADAARRLAE
jgi:hypothetical protein